MGSYRSEDDALIGLARQLTDAYGEARRREDQDYACDSIAEFLADSRDTAPDEALLAILDLPLTAETYPLVDEAQTVLAGRGSGVVRMLLEAVLGEVYDPDGPAPERAAETLDMMDRRASLRGLTDVLRGRAGDDVKGAAVDALVALGAFAEPELAAALDDPRGGEWAKAALDQIRYEQTHPEAYRGVGDEEARDAVADWPDSIVDPEGESADPDEEWAGAGESTGGEVQAGDAETEQLETGTETDAEAEAPPPGPTSRGEIAPSSGPVAPASPERTTVDDAYDEFLRRFEAESGEETSAP